MKLSMWMIANRLSSLDMELHIKESAPPILKSARRAYATNCVHVYSDGNDVIYDGEGDTIRIFDMDLTAGFEILQEVFDYFEDWMDRLTGFLAKKNYQGIVDLSWQVLHNPLILMDDNSRVLGITRQYPDDALDEEWYYLCHYGYTSLNAVKVIRDTPIDKEFWKHGAQSYRFAESNQMKYSGRSFSLQCNGMPCGRLTLLSKERELNQGDFQLLELLAALLEPCMGQARSGHTVGNVNVFYQLLMDEPYEERDLEVQLAQYQWKTDDRFYLTMVEVLRNDDMQIMDKSMEGLMQIIRYHSKNYIIIKCTPYILILSNWDLSGDANTMGFFLQLKTHNPIKISFSLPCRNVRKIPYLYEQALYPLRTHGDEEAGKVYYFFNDAVSYMIESESFIHALHACMPAVVRLWNMQKQGSELFLTLKTYLDFERSVAKTSEALFAHRNTVIYRMRKIQEMLKVDLSDAYVRNYCRLSVYFLELFEKRQTP